MRQPQRDIMLGMHYPGRPDLGSCQPSRRSLHLLGAKAVEVGGLSRPEQAASNRGRSSKGLLDAAGKVRDDWPEQRSECAGTTELRHREEAGWPGGVAQVGVEALFQTGTPESRQARPHQQEPEAEHEPKARSCCRQVEVRDAGDGSHRSTRSSSGRRPMRSMTR